MFDTSNTFSESCRISSPVPAKQYIVQANVALTAGDLELSTTSDQETQFLFNPNSSLTTNLLIVGDNGQAIFKLIGNSKVTTSGNMILGNQAGSAGVFNGNDLSSLDIGGDLFVGKNGFGHIDGVGSISARNVYIADATHSGFNITKNSQLNVKENIVIGQNERGVVNLKGGDMQVGKALILGQGKNAEGELNAENVTIHTGTYNTETSAFTPGTVQIGVAGKAALFLDNRSVLSTDNVILGGSSSTLSVTRRSVVELFEFKQEGTGKTQLGFDGAYIHNKPTSHLLFGNIDPSNIYVGRNGLTLDKNYASTDETETVLANADKINWDVGNFYFAKDNGKESALDRDYVYLKNGEIGGGLNILGSNGKQRVSLGWDTQKAFNVPLHVGQNAIVTIDTGTDSSKTLTLDAPLMVSLNTTAESGLKVNSQLTFTEKATLTLRALDAVRELIEKQSLSWDNLITASKINGQFASHNVIDKDGNTIANGADLFKVDYTDTAVNVRLTSSSTTPTQPVEPSKPTQPVEPTKPTQPVEPTQPTESAKPIQPPQSTLTDWQGSTLGEKLYTFRETLLNKADQNSTLVQTLGLIEKGVAISEAEKYVLMRQLSTTLRVEVMNAVAQQAQATLTNLSERLIGYQGAYGTTKFLVPTLENVLKRKDTQVWATGLYNEGNQKTANDIVGYKTKSTGSMLGVDKYVSDNFRIGLALAYSQHKQTASDNISPQSAKNRTVQGLIYGSYHTTENTALHGYFGYGQARIDSQRFLNIADVSQTATGNFNADIWQGGLGVSHRIGTAKTYLQPFAQLSYQNISTDAYQETGANLFNLGVDKQRFEMVKASLGTYFSQTLSPKVQLIGHLAGHIEHQDDSELSTRFIGTANSDFTFTAAKQGKFSATAGLGVRFQPTANTELSLNYIGTYRKANTSHGGQLGFKWSF